MLPNDPMILLSVVNTKLRDEYDSLEALCDDLELDEDTYFVADLIGLEVKDADTGAVYGKIVDVMQTGANDVYVIKGEREYLVPAIADVVVSTDVDGGVMTIRPLDGLFD